MASLSGRLTSSASANLTSFVGRRNDLVAVRQLFSVTRLVTITGMGGVGKTRLALRAAGEMERAFPDGTYLVELGSLRQPDLVPHTVMDALEIFERPVSSPMTAIREFLGDRSVLLILDNCEHLVEATADFLDQLLRTVPGVSVLATSRQAIRISGEHIYPVAPMVVPDPADRIGPGASAHYPSVALFADRASAIVPGFAVTPANEAAVVRLCHRLEGIPLAIELAAVRLRVLTVHDLADRIDDRFQLLREGNRNVPERHRTLQALIDWSYDLCTPAEQLLWARSAVFVDGFTAEAVEAICADEQLPATEILDTVAGLVDKSVLVREERDAHVRFRMLDTINAYGRARMIERVEDVVMARRHRDWYARLLACAEEEWAGPRQRDWTLRLQSEYANIRHALDFCVSTPGESRIGLSMAAMPWFWTAMDHLDEARLWLDRMLELEQEASHERAWALAANAYIAAFQGDRAEFATLSEQARSLALELDDLAALAFANHVCSFRQSFGAADTIHTAVPMFTEALDQYLRAGVPAQYSDSLREELAVTHLVLGHYDDAAAVIDEMFERCRAAGESWSLSYALWLRGLLGLVRGDVEGAEQCLVEALRIKRSFRDALGWALTLEGLVWTAATRGDAERAAVLLGATDRLWQGIGRRQLVSLRAPYLALVMEELDERQFEKAHARGEQMSAEEALSFALDENPVVQPEPKDLQGPQPKLSRREMEVAQLVAEGMSNREIAAKLVISLRTAEGHVENILAKLGFRTRTQVAGWMLRLEREGAARGSR